jgi:3-oxoacyl-[acyl-carrier-protein] synthase II
MLAARREATAWARSLSTLSFAPPPPIPPRRVVVTGMGAVTPFGVGVGRAWENVLNSQCAIEVRQSLCQCVGRWGG